MYSLYEWLCGVPRRPRDGLDAVQRSIGVFGRYHVFLCLVIFACKFTIAFCQLSIIFLAPKVNFTCGSEIAASEIAAIVKPEIVKPEGGEVGGTRRVDSLLCPCPNPVYDRSVFTQSIVMEWDLICDRKWLISFNQMMFQLGTLCGSVSFGMAADRYGRKKPLIASVCICLVGGIISVYVTSFTMFNLMRFISGVSIGGLMVVSFVLLMEFVGSKYRDVISALYQVPFNIGNMLLPLIAYYVRDWRKYQLAISLPTIVLLSYFCLLWETPRWLIAVKRTDEAINILEKVAKINNLPTANIRRDVEEYQVDLEKRTLKKGSILDLFRTPHIRKNIICMSMNWLACSYCFYGVSQYVGQLSGDVFLNVALAATLALAGSLFSIPLMKIMGRKAMLISQNFIAAGCLLAMSMLGGEGQLSVILAVIGVMASFIVFVTVYLHCGEIFPTVVRNAAVGFSSMMARVGSMVAPFVVDTRSYGPWVPPLLFAIFPLIAGILAFFLPETKGKQLLTTIREAEERG